MIRIGCLVLVVTRGWSVRSVYRDEEINWLVLRVLCVTIYRRMSRRNAERRAKQHGLKCCIDALAVAQ